jgi:hypothetical protein
MRCKPAFTASPMRGQLISPIRQSLVHHRPFAKAIAAFYARAIALHHEICGELIARRPIPARSDADRIRTASAHARVRVPMPRAPTMSGEMTSSVSESCVELTPNTRPRNLAGAKVASKAAYAEMESRQSYKSGCEPSDQGQMFRPYFDWAHRRRFVFGPKHRRDIVAKSTKAGGEQRAERRDCQCEQAEQQKG